MKVIFLDVDGVLNVMSDSYRTFMKPYGEHIEPWLVQRLNYIVEKTDSKIVISSSWKSCMDDLEKQMKDQGFKYWDNVIGRTPFSGEMNETGEESGYRGLQINEWLKIHNFFDIESFVVIEDEIDDVCGNRCNVISRESVVEVDMNEGLTHKNVVDAIDILNSINLQKRDLIINQKILEGLFPWQAKQFFYEGLK